MHKKGSEDFVLKFKVLNFEECEYFLIRVKEISKFLENIIRVKSILN